MGNLISSLFYIIFGYESDIHDSLCRHFFVTSYVYLSGLFPNFNDIISYISLQSMIFSLNYTLSYMSKSRFEVCYFAQQIHIHHQNQQLLCYFLLKIPIQLTIGHS